MNTGKLQIGSFSLARNPGERRWLVQFRLPEGQRRRESSRLPVCGRCLAESEAVRTRPACVCQREARAWASVRLDDLAAAWRAGRLVTRAAEPVTLAEVVAIYAERGPADRAECLAALRRVVEVSKGIPLERVRLDELHPDDWDRWAWCAQERERRGWTRRDGTAPADSWEQVRRACPEHPELDRENVTTGNTTILSQWRKARAVLGPDSRDNYLKPLRERWPREAVEAWLDTKLRLRTPDPRFNLSRDVYTAMWQSLPALRIADPAAWALLRLLWTTGLRPIEARHARITWLESMPDGQRVLVVKNRPDDGFVLKDRTTTQARRWPLPADLLDLLPRLSSPSGNLLGCDTASQWDRLYRRASAWLRTCGVTGSQTLYTLRKLVGTIKLSTSPDAMAAALGHSNTQTGLTHYARPQPVQLDALTDAELEPLAVMAAWGNR